MIEFISFAVGIVMRFLNEHSKDKAKQQEFLFKAALAKNNTINMAKEATASSTFLQIMMSMLVFGSFVVIAGFSLLAALLDLPLVIETIKSEGFWIFSKDVKTFTEITGLLLPEEFRFVIIECTKFLFGAVVGGIGRR
jgi:hypothetical protein